MVYPLTFEEWAGQPPRNRLVMALIRMLVEEKTEEGANDLVEEFRREGYGAHVDSWVLKEGWKRLTAEDVRRVLGEEVLDDLAVDAEISLDQARAQLAVILPEFISRLCPRGGGRPPPPRKPWSTTCGPLPADAGWTQRVRRTCRSSPDWNGSSRALRQQLAYFYPALRASLVSQGSRRDDRFDPFI